MAGRPECMNCEGATQEACNAIFSDVRSLAGSSALGMRLSDTPAVIRERQSEMRQKGVEFGQRLKEIGCKLNESQLTSAFLSESLAGIMQSATNAEEVE